LPVAVSGAISITNTSATFPGIPSSSFAAGRCAGSFLLRAQQAVGGKATTIPATSAATMIDRLRFMLFPPECENQLRTIGQGSTIATRHRALRIPYKLDFLDFPAVFQYKKIGCLRLPQGFSNRLSLT
jgi:hypothetical protein